ncbi:MAG: hypothetical protein AAGI68_07535 [Planctomycetota bacterium]
MKRSFAIPKPQVLAVCLVVITPVAAAPRAPATTERSGEQRWDLALPWYQRAWSAAQDIEPPKARWNAMLVAAQAIAIGGSRDDVETLARDIAAAKELGRLEPNQARLLQGFCALVLDQPDALEFTYRLLKPDRRLAEQLEDAAACWYAEQGNRAEMTRWRDRRLADEPEKAQHDWEQKTMGRHDPRRLDPEAPLRRLHTAGRCVGPALQTLAREPGVPAHRINYWLSHHERHCRNGRPDWDARAEIAWAIAQYDPHAATAYLPDDPADSTGFNTHSNLRVWRKTGRIDLAVRAIEAVEIPLMQARWASGFLLELDADGFDRFHARLLPLIRPWVEGGKPKPYHVVRMIGSRWALGRPDQAQRVLDLYPQLADHPFTLARRHALAGDWKAVERVMHAQPSAHETYRVLIQAMDSAKPPPAWLLHLTPSLQPTTAARHARNLGREAARRGNAPLAREAIRVWQAVLDQPITDDPYGYSLAHLISIRYHLQGPVAAALMLDQFPRPGSAYIVAGRRFTPAQHLTLWHLLVTPEARFYFAIRRGDACLPSGNGWTVRF